MVSAITHVEERVETPNHILECAGGRPTHAVDRALPQQTQADVSVLGDVRMPYAGQTFDLRRLRDNSWSAQDRAAQLEPSAYQNVVLLRHFDDEPKPPARPKAVFGRRYVELKAI